MPGFVSLTEGFRPLPYTSSFVSKRLLLHSLNVLLLAPREGTDCKDRESFRDTQLRDASGDAPRSRFACAKVRTSRRTRKRGEDFFQDGETGRDARCYVTPRYDELKNVKKKKERDRHPPLKTKKRGTRLIRKKQIHIIIYKTILTNSNNITIRIVKKSLLYIHFSSIKTILNDFRYTHNKVFQPI